MSEFSCPNCGTKLKVAVAQTEAKKTFSLKDARGLFPKDLENMLSFEQTGQYMVIKPRQWLGSENFAKISSIIRGAGGEFISAGKESHFRLTKKGPE